MHRFLKDADAVGTTGRSPRRKVRLFALERVREVERDPVFRAERTRIGQLECALAYDLGVQKEQRAREALQRDERGAAAMREVEIDVILMPMDELWMKALRHFDARQAERGNWECGAGELRESDEEFSARIMVNYLRHECTRYDDLRCEATANQEGSKTHAVIVQRVFAAIAAKYPELAEECERRSKWKTREPDDDFYADR